MYFSKILVTTDLSEASFQAFDLAAYEAKMQGAEVHLLHVIQYYYPVLVTPDIPVPPPGAEFYRQMRQESMNRLNELAEQHFHGQIVTTEVLLSKESAAESICDYAKKHGIKAVVMASRGHSLLNMVFMGSTVQQVLLRSELPVIVIPAKK